MLKRQIRQEFLKAQQALINSKLKGEFLERELKGVDKVTTQLIKAILKEAQATKENIKRSFKTREAA